MTMVSGASAATSSATCSYARIVFVICFSLPFPTSGMIIGGWGTMKAAKIGMTDLPSVFCGSLRP